MNLTCSSSVIVSMTRLNAWFALYCKCRESHFLAAEASRWAGSMRKSALALKITGKGELVI